MELNSLDTAILEAIQSIDDGNGGGCGWLPSMRTHTGLETSYVVNTFPALIQYIDNEKETDLPNGDVLKEIQFYLVCPKKTLDTLEVRILHDMLNKKVLQFAKKLNRTFNCEFIGDRERLIEQLPMIEAGILFTLAIKVDHECLT